MCLLRNAIIRTMSAGIDIPVIPAQELEFSAIRASGPGGQNVNKVSTAIELRFNINASESLDDAAKARLCALRDRRISRDGIIVIKAQRSRSQERNREDAVRRLNQLIARGLQTQKPRKATKPGRRAKEKRLEDKAHRARIKRSRGPVTD